MSPNEFKAAVRKARRVFVTSPCTGTKPNVERGQADDVQHFQISKAEACRVLLGGQDGDIIALVTERGDLFIG